jgi:hypothetical protein
MVCGWMGGCKNSIVKDIVEAEKIVNSNKNIPRIFEPILTNFFSASKFE